MKHICDHLWPILPTIVHSPQSRHSDFLITQIRVLKIPQCLPVSPGIKLNLISWPVWSVSGLHLHTCLLCARMLSDQGLNMFFLLQAMWWHQPSQFLLIFVNSVPLFSPQTTFLTSPPSSIMSVTFYLIFGFVFFHNTWLYGITLFFFHFIIF